MKLTWTPAGGSAFDIGDDTATPRKTIQVENMDGACQVQREPLYAGANAYQQPRANVAGMLIVVCTCSHADLDTASTYIAQEYGRIGQKGSLVWARGATVNNTFANAVLERVTTAKINGVQVGIRYSFAIAAIS